MRVLNCNLFLTALGAAVLTACGGGGGDAPASTPAASTATFPVQTAFQALIKTPQNFNLSTTFQGNSFQISFNTTPGANENFEGALRRSRVEVFTLRQNGTVIDTSSSISFFDLNAPSPVGAIDSDGSYEVITMQGVLPVTSTVGMQVVGWTSVTYADSSKLTKTSDSTLNWSLDADTATTAWLCGNYVDRNTDSTTDSGSECYKIDTSGQILGYKATVVVDGVELNFQ